MNLKCDHCHQPLTKISRFYHKYICLDWQYAKAKNNIKSLLKKYKLSTRQYEILLDLFKENVKAIYNEEIIQNSKNLTSQQNYQGILEFFSQPEISKYFSENNDQTNFPAYCSFIQEMPFQPTPILHNQSYNFGQISEIDKEDTSCIVLKEIMSLSEMLGDLNIEDIEIILDENEITKRKKRNPRQQCIECPICMQVLSSKQYTVRHIKQQHILGGENKYHKKNNKKKERKCQK